MFEFSTKQNILDLYLALQSLCKCVYLLPHCSLHSFCPLMSLDHHQGCGGLLWMNKLDDSQTRSHFVFYGVITKGCLRKL